MTSNSEKMTTAEKLAQKIKESPLGTFIDEDELADIAKDALQLAFFKPRSDNSDRWHTKTLPPLVVEMATEAFREQIKESIKPVVDMLVDDAEFRKLLLDATMAAIPETTRNIVYGIIQNAQVRTTTDIMGALNNSIGRKLGIDLYSGNPQ